MSEVGLTVSVNIEGAQETTRQLKEISQTCNYVEVTSKKSLQEIYNLTRDAANLIHTVTALDYAWNSWERAAKQFDIMSFTRAVLATINLVQALIKVLRVAQAEEAALGGIQIGGAVAGGTQTATNILPGVIGTSTVGVAAATTKGNILSTILGGLGGIGLIAGGAISAYWIVSGFMEVQRNITIEAERQKARDEVLKIRLEILTEMMQEMQRNNGQLFRENYRSVAPGG